MNFIGRILICDQEGHGRGPCQHCGSIRFKIEPGKAMHAFGLRCAECRNSYKWLSHRKAERVTDADFEMGQAQ